MQLEALQLLKDQLSDHFIDRYEEFQSVFYSNMGGGSTLEREIYQGHSNLATNYPYVDDAYTLYPEHSVKAGGGASVSQK